MTISLKTGQAGINLIKRYEGCRLEAYKCPAGVWTIGYGHTGDVQPRQKITQAQAEAILIADLEKFEKKVNVFYNRYRWTQNEFDALVSFAFNIGSIDQLTAGGTRSRDVIAEKFLLYNKAAGKVLAGLTKRREAERLLFLHGQSSILNSERAKLRIGSRGENVAYLQECLTAKGYGVGNIDGIFGIKTLEAVKKFQSKNGLAVDGIVGTKTWTALNN